MDVWRLLGAVLRRWYIFVPLMATALVAAVTVSAWVQPEYSASAVIGVAPNPASSAPQEGDLTNPYGSLTYTAGVLEQVLNSSAVQQQLMASGLTGGVEIQAIPRTSFLGIAVAAPDPDAAIATGRGVIAIAGEILAERQNATQVRPSQYVVIDVLDDADSVSVSSAGQVQALAAVLAVGGILAFLTTVVVDDLLLRRRSRAALRTGGAEFPSGDGDVEATQRVQAIAGNGTSRVDPSRADRSSAGAPSPRPRADHPRAPSGESARR